MASTLIIIVVVLLACIFLAWRDDKITNLEQRVEFLEQKSNKKLVSRLLFVELKSVKSVLDTLNNCFYQIDKNGDYDIDTEYRLTDVTDEWWEALSAADLEIVNKIK
ncbi:MAG TPA: hypothetical protein VMU83_14235 [Hanamia sp.]|nr:hypothetical protein [Hanamia sp.]